MSLFDLVSEEDKKDYTIQYPNVEEFPKEVLLGYEKEVLGIYLSGHPLEDYLDKKTEYGWYLCLDENRIVGGMGVIENDFHDRKDLTPNVCAVYTEEEYRRKGIAGHLLNMVVEDLKSKNISPVYLVTDHTGFYERYGWEFLCKVQGDDEPDMTRMYIHR